jgi:hypothetical protein
VAAVRGEVLPPDAVVPPAVARPVVIATQYDLRCYATEVRLRDGTIWRVTDHVLADLGGHRFADHAACAEAVHAGLAYFVTTTHAFAAGYPRRET